MTNDPAPSEGPVPPRAEAWLDFLTALQFLSRVPVQGAMGLGAEAYAKSLRQSVIFFPLVGALITVATATVLLGALVLFPPVVAVLVAIAFEACLTGAFHEDALADFCDAFGGGWTRDDVLRILKDSRLGSFGVLGLGLGVAIRVATLSQLARDDVWLAAAALVASGTLGRLAILVVMRLLPPISERESIARDVGQAITSTDLVRGSALALPGVFALAILDPLAVVTSVPLIGVSAWFFARYVQRRIGGVTGDCLGCFCYVAQLLVLLAAVARLPGLAS